MPKRTVFKTLEKSGIPAYKHTDGTFYVWINQRDYKKAQVTKSALEDAFKKLIGSVKAQGRWSKSGYNYNLYEIYQVGVLDEIDTVLANLGIKSTGGGSTVRRVDFSKLQKRGVCEAGGYPIYLDDKNDRFDFYFVDLSKAMKGKDRLPKDKWKEMTSEIRSKAKGWKYIRGGAFRISTKKGDTLRFDQSIDELCEILFKYIGKSKEPSKKEPKEPSKKPSPKQDWKKRLDAVVDHMERDGHVVEAPSGDFRYALLKNPVELATYLRSEGTIHAFDFPLCGSYQIMHSTFGRPIGYGITGYTSFWLLYDYEYRVFYSIHVPSAVASSIPKGGLKSNSLVYFNNTAYRVVGLKTKDNPINLKGVPIADVVVNHLPEIIKVHQLPLPRPVSTTAVSNLPVFDDEELSLVEYNGKAALEYDNLSFEFVGMMPLDVSFAAIAPIAERINDLRTRIIRLYPTLDSSKKGFRQLAAQERELIMRFGKLADTDGTKYFTPLQDALQIAPIEYTAEMSRSETAKGIKELIDKYLKD